MGGVRLGGKLARAHKPYNTPHPSVYTCRYAQLLYLLPASVRVCVLSRRQGGTKWVVCESQCTLCVSMSRADCNTAEC